MPHELHLSTTFLQFYALLIHKALKMLDIKVLLKMSECRRLFNICSIVCDSVQHFCDSYFIMLHVIQTRKCQIEDFFVAGFTGSFQTDNLCRSQWRKFCQNNLSVTGKTYRWSVVQVKPKCKCWFVYIHIYDIKRCDVFHIMVLCEYFHYLYFNTVSSDVS